MIIHLLGRLIIKPKEPEFPVSQKRIAQDLEKIRKREEEKRQKEEEAKRKRKEDFERVEGKAQ